jgi:hypothetical protein
VFYIPDAASTSTTTTPGDLFGRVPNELISNILSHVNSKDIASLRLSSRRFRQLPQSLFHDLLVREMPWLWETWCTMDYARWVGTSATELKHDDDKWQAEKANIELSIRILRHEAEGTTDNEDAVAALRGLIAQRERDTLVSHKPTPVSLLPAAETNWHALYTAVTRNWPRLQGLQNRERIWTDCEAILDEMERFRVEGLMGPGITVDVEAMAREQSAKRRKRNKA